MNHYVGNVYRLVGDNVESDYILAMVDALPGFTSQVGLIERKSGNRWTRPYLFSVTDRVANMITDEEFKTHVAGTSGREFELVRLGPAAEYARQRGQLQWLQAL
jgi:hypothetical protein